MSKRIDADYSASFLFPPHLEDWVGPEHPARFIRDFVDAFDLEALGFESAAVPSAPGAPAYGAGLLLKVWLWGYCEGIRSTRRLENACRNQLPLLWLTGVHYPDHNTLWRFWHKNREALRGLFKETVRVAAQSGALGLAVHAVDGTKIHAWASKKKTWHQEDLERLARALDDEIQALEEALQQEGEGEGPAYPLPEQLRDARARKEAIDEALSEVEASGEKHLHPHDRDARMMATPEGTRLSYNAQAVADDKHQILVAEDVAQVRNDHLVLNAMLDQAVANVGAPPEVTLGDGGYNSSQALATALESGHTVLVGRRNAKPGPYHASRFDYDPQRDCFTCPQGQTLHHVGGGFNKSHGCEVTRYRCTHAAQCPVRAQCTKSRKGRIVERTPWQDAADEHRRRAATNDAKALMRKRKAIIEPVFATIKQHGALRRWTQRGLENVRTQWSIQCAVYNLKKLYTLWRQRPGPQPDRRPPLGCTTVAGALKCFSNAQISDAGSNNRKIPTPA
jgi:transposase